jgi:CelD/BcsL family acetyltransferase involved in cellulose biosynthesis
LTNIQLAEEIKESQSPATLSGGPVSAVHRLSPIDDPRWSEYLSRTPEATLFHSATWLEALRRTYGYQPAVLTTSPEGKRLENGLLFCIVESALTGRRAVSVPFSDYCQPLAETSEDLSALFSAAEAEVKTQSWRYFEVRPLVPTGISRPNWQTSAVYLHHQVDLEPDVDVLFKNLHKDSVQRKIQRAEREGLRYETGASESLLEAFYQIMVQTRSRHGVPPQPKQWFRSLVEGFGSNLQIRVAFHRKSAVAATMTIRHKDTLIYKYGGSDVLHNKLGGMHLLYWNAIQDAKRWGLQTFDLGRTDADQTGLATFKKRWGASESCICYSRCTGVGEVKHGFELAVPTWKMRAAKTLFRKTPNKLLPVVGSILYRHFG